LPFGDGRHGRKLGVAFWGRRADLGLEDNKMDPELKVGWCPVMGCVRKYSLRWKKIFNIYPSKKIQHFPKRKCFPRQPERAKVFSMEKIPFRKKIIALGLISKARLDLVQLPVQKKKTCCS
jgi:hypothetical protein